MERQSLQFAETSKIKTRLGKASSKLEIGKKGKTRGKEVV